jgi:hypothetical protein
MLKTTYYTRPPLTRRDASLPELRSRLVEVLNVVQRLRLRLRFWLRPCIGKEWVLAHLGWAGVIVAILSILV